MRILMIAHGFPPTFGGVESHLWDISTRIAGHGHTVCCLVGGEQCSREILGNISVIRQPNLTVQNLLASRLGLAPSTISGDLLNDLARTVSDTVEEFAPECIHIHNSHHFAPELALALFTQVRGIPLINGVHDRVGEYLFEEVIRYSWDHVLYASNYLSKSIPTHCPSSVLWLGIDLAQFSPQGRVDPRFGSLEHPIIFHPARLLEWKGVEVGLRAFIDIRRRLGRGTLVLCSSENIVDDQAEVKKLREKLAALAREADADDSVRFLTFPKSEIDSAYRAADLVWYPTIDDEPFGLVPLEAMACRTPLVVSRSGGMVETVVDGETGLIVDKHDHRSLANAAITLLTDEALRNRIVNQAEIHVQKFDADSYVEELENIYRRSISHDGSQGKFTVGGLDGISAAAERDQ